MLDPWIIEEIRRQEEEVREREQERAHLEIQIETPSESEHSGRREHPATPHPKNDRGVTIIDFGV